MTSQLGINHFLEMMNDYHPKWKVVAVKASVDVVSEGLLELIKVKQIIRGVQVSETDSEDLSRVHLIAVVQPTENPWSVIWGEFEICIQSLSISLKTKSAELAMEDTGASTAYEIYDSGQLIERAAWHPDSAMEYESTVRPHPELYMLTPDKDALTYDEQSGVTHNEQIFHDFVDRIFSKEKLYIPTCWPCKVGESYHLFVEKWSVGSVERANILLV